MAGWNTPEDLQLKVTSKQSRLMHIQYIEQVFETTNVEFLQV